MRLLLLSMDYPPRMAGGTTIQTYNLAKALTRLLNEVHVIAAGAEGAAKTEISEGIHIHRVHRPYTLFSAFKARALARKLDIVHGDGICAYGHLKLNNAPTIVKMHNTWLAEYERYKGLKDKPRLMRLYVHMDRYCANKADAVICVSEAVKRDTQRYGVQDAELNVAYNGVDLTQFNSTEGLRAELGLKGTVVGYAGQLEIHKGVDDLIAAMKNFDARLLVVGDGSIKNELVALSKKLIPGRATFTGYVPYHQLSLYYNTMDIVVHPSHHGPLSNIVLETMAVARPIIASNVGSIPEIFEDGCGYLVEPTAQAIAEKLAILVDNEAMRRRMGEKARSVARRYSWENTARATLKICENVLSS